MNSTFRGAITLATLAIPSLGTAVHAQLAFDVTGAGSAAFGKPGTVGYTFNALTPITVTELDAYIGLGFTSPAIPVGIYDSAGALLTSVTISQTAPGSTTPSANGGSYIGATIAPLTLPIGTYTIGEYGANASDRAAAQGTIIISDPSVSYGSAALSPGGESGLTDPTPLGASIALFGPSFKFISAPAATPEPGSIALLVGMGVTGAGVFRKRRK